MDREMEHHLEMATRRNLARGLPPDIARRHARLAFGSIEAVKEEAREAHRARLAETVIADVRFALRSLRRSPAFTLAAVLTLALGIGATTAMFSVVNAVLLRPLPIPAPGDFRYFGWAWPKGGDIPSLTDLQYEFVRDRGRVLDAVAAYRNQEAHLGDEAGAQPIRGLRVTSEFLRTLGFVPRLGRWFDARELDSEAPVVILSEPVWRVRFGADSGIVGRPIRLDGVQQTVIGVLPPDFHFPPAPDDAGYLLPLTVRPNPNDEGHNTEVIARLRPGVPDAAVEADLRTVSSAFRATHPTLTDTGTFRLFSHVEVQVGSSLRRTLWLLFGAITLVLLIACANTATLFLIRASARQREIAVRASIGATPRRILQQLLTEGLVLSATATGLGILLSLLTLRIFLTAAPNAFPAGTEPGLGAGALVFAVMISALTGVGFGLVAAVPTRRARLHSAVLRGSHGGTRGSAGARHALVFLEAALAVVLLAGASLLVTSFARLIRVDPGFDADRVTAIRLGRLPPGPDPGYRDQLVQRLFERVRALPGVEQAALAPNLPLERGLNFPVDTPERPDLGMGAVELRFVSPGYLATLGIALRGGRPFDDGDVPGAEPVAIVNEAFARRFWPDQAPIGRMIRIGHLGDRWRIGPAARHETRVIGVAADIHEVGLDRPVRPTVLVPRAQLSDGVPLLLVRGKSPGLSELLRSAIGSEEPSLAPVVEPLRRVVSRSVAAPRFRTMLIGAFAGFAILLAGIGIYGVIASGVQHRRREIALRLALGASATAVASAVSRRCLAIVAAGALTGLIGFWAIRRVLTSWLFDLTPGDPLVLAVAVVVLATVAGFASWLPTRRATRLHPATVLRLD